ncbi:thioredoxin-like 1-2, chloroplastic [Wolffia australiana]
MAEMGSAQELAECLLAAGDRLVVVDFYSPGCGGCRVLHPKICQIAEKNPDVIFLKVNYEEHPSLCAGLRVHVLPFFRFYRGAAGRVCSFSCTTATINKFRDAMAKHGGVMSDAGPSKGLEDSELLRLASCRDFLFTPPRRSAVFSPFYPCGEREGTPALAP